MIILHAIIAQMPRVSSHFSCWMQSIIYWITVVGYFCIIFLLNVSMFVVVLIQLCRIKKQKQLGYQRKTMLQDVRSVAGITCLLGITWGLGFFSFGPGKTVIQYLFAIFNSLQGLFIYSSSSVKTLGLATNTVQSYNLYN